MEGVASMITGCPTSEFSGPGLAMLAPATDRGS
jgi:hypothetical protein